MLFFGPGESQIILYRKGLTPENNAFAPFRSLIKQIDDLLPQIKDDKQLEYDLENLKCFYNSYIQSLCQCEDDPHRKEELLAKKVFLKTEKPVELSKIHNLAPNVAPVGPTFGFYRISQEMARILISKDRFGFTDKKNDTGLRSVQSQGGVHFKFLNSSLDDPRPGTEYMAYALSKSLTSRMLITPSVLLKL